MRSDDAPSHTPAPSAPRARYEICVAGTPEPHWTAWFEGLAVTCEDATRTVISGPVADQAALHGVLAKVRDLGLTLVSVNERLPVVTRELRIALTFDDYDAALRLFRDVLGLAPVQVLDAQGGRGVILDLPAATLELFDRRHGALVDEIEVGRVLDQRMRIAVWVDDLRQADEAVMAAGARPEGEPVDTPWGDRNRRYHTADNLQLTLFERRTDSDSPP